MQLIPIFSDVYNSEFKHTLSQAENLRKRILLNYTIVSSVILIGFALEAVTWMSIGIAVVIVFVLAYSHHFGISKSDFVRKYQTIVGRYLAITLYGGIHYDYDSYHKLKTLNEAYLISGFPKQYGGKHLSSFMFSEIHCSISEITSHSNRKNANGLHENFQIFNGLVGFAEINLSMNDPALIVSDNSISECISLTSHAMQGAIKKEGFTVYNQDNEYVYKLVSPSVWLLLIRFLEKSRAGIFMSLTQNGLCIAVESTDFLKTNLMHSVYRKKEIERYFEAFQFIITILQLTCRHYQESENLIKS